MADFYDISIGDVVIYRRNGVDSHLYVTAVTAGTIRCSRREFSRATGMELDYSRGWTETRSGACIVGKA
jgi:hypothetical protein